MFSRTMSAMVLPRDPNVQRLRAQPRSLAVRTLRIAAIPAQEHAHVNFVFLRFHFVEEPVNVFEDQRLFLRRQIAERHVPADFAARGLAEMRGVPLVLRLGPRLHRAFVERKARIGNHQIHVVVDGVAETLGSAGTRPWDC